MAHVKEVEVEPPMHLQRPSSGRSQDVSHLLASLFRELFTREAVGEETVKHLSTSKSGEESYHDKYVEQLRKIQEKRDERHRQADMLEAHIMQARAAATAADERELQNASEGCENYFSLGLPPGRSNLRYCLDTDLLKRHNLIVPEDFASEDPPPAKPPEPGDIPSYARHTTSSHQRYRRTPPLTDYFDDVKSSSSLTYPFMSKATFLSSERRCRESSPTSTKSKSNKSWKESMNPDQREVEREDLKRLQSKSEYKRNPRFVPPLRADLVKSKEKTKTSRKEKDDGLTDAVDVFLPTPSPLVFTNYRVNEVYELMLDLKNITSSSRQVRVVPPRTSHFSVGLGRFPGETGVVAPGMSCQYPIRFAPDSLADYDDVIRIKSQAVPDLEIPLQARRPPPVLTLSRILDCGHCLVGGKEVTKFTCRNTGGDGRFCVMDKASWPTVSFPWSMTNPGSVEVEPFELKPAMFELKSGDSIEIEVTFSPSAAKFFNEDIRIICDNCNVKSFSLQGTGQTANIQFISISGGVSEPGLGEIRDVSSQFFIRFKDQNPNTKTDKALVIKNTTNVALPFHWNMYKPELLCPSTQNGYSGENSISAQLVRTRDNGKAFSILPNMGTMPPHDTVEFTLEFAPQNLGDFHSVLHLVLEAIPLHAVTPEVNHTKNVTAIELELKASSKPFNVRVEPSAVVVPGSLTLGKTYRYPVKMFNHSKSEVHFNWEPIEISGGTITVEPQRQFLVVDEELDVELCLTGTKQGSLEETICCNINFISSPVYLHVKAFFEGPEVTMDIQDLDFGLVRLGESCERKIPIRNLSSVPAQWTMQECLDCSMEHLKELQDEEVCVSEFSFTPHSGMLDPGEGAEVSVMFTPGDCSRVRTVIQCWVLNGKTSYLSVRGEVQTPQVCLLSCNLYIEEVYVGVPVAREVVLQNQTLLSARFNWNELVNEVYSISFEPNEGLLQPRETLPVKVLFTGHKKGPVSDLVTSCEVDGVDTPIYLSIDGDVRGLSVTFETPKEIDIESRPSEEDIQQWDSSALLLDFKEVSLGSNPKTTLVLTNTSAIRTSFSIDMEYLRPAKPPTPPQGAPTNKTGGQRTQNLLRRTANVADPLSKTATKAHESYCQALLRDGRGAAFMAYPSSGELLPFGYQVIDVVGYSDMWGQYRDRLVCKIEGLEPAYIPVTMDVVGCPLNFQMMKDQKSVLRFGTHVSGAPPIKRNLRVNNTSPYDIRLDWETYNIEPDDDQILDLLMYVGRPLPVLNGGQEVEPKVEEQREEDNRPFIQVNLREHVGKRCNRPFEITPSQQVIPAKGFAQMSVSFIPHTDSPTGQSCSSFATAYLSLDGPNTNVSGYVTRTQGIDMEPFHLDMTANVKPAMLAVEMEEDKGTHYFAAASDLLKNVSSKVHRFILRNTTEAVLQLALDVSPPFSVLSLEPPPSAKSSRSHSSGLVTVKPNKNVEVKVSFSITREQIARVKEMRADEEQSDGCVFIREESGERRLEFKKDLKIEFSNKASQVLPLTATVVIPTLRLSAAELDFGTCLVGQERELLLTLCNPTASYSSWRVRKDSRYPESSRDAFTIKPSGGELEAYVSHVSQNKTLIKVTFIARHNVEYECVFIFSGSLEEEEQRLVVRGKGSYDGRHENLVNVLTEF